MSKNGVLGASAACILAVSAAFAFRAIGWQNGEAVLGAHLNFGQPVRTTSGLVLGHEATGSNHVYEFLGIPYAQPPLGDLRFAPPQPFTGSDKLDGSKFGFSCPHPSLDVAKEFHSLNSIVSKILDVVEGGDQAQSEDCLTINVWTKPSADGRKKPVMLWSHGGGYITGSSASTAYNGKYWADHEDVVLMSFNYRMGVLGFPGNKDLTQNLAFLDQRLAVEWVRDNAKAFGGDPSRIILFGESAGSAMSDYYNYIWLEDPIIAGTISQSGQASNLVTNSIDDQSKKWEELSTAVGCGNSTTRPSGSVLACMRDSSKVTASDLLAATAQIAPGPDNIIFSTFGPTVDNKTVFPDYIERGLDGRFIRNPALVGCNDYEGGYLTLIYGAYGHDLPAAQAEVIGQSLFACTSGIAADARRRHDVPVWRYRYFPSFSNLEIPTSKDRAYHMAEVPPLFSTSADLTGLPDMPAQSALGSYMRSAWAAFARSPSEGLSKGQFHWPQHDANSSGTPDLVLLGKDRSTGAHFVPRGDYDVGCE